MGKALEIVKIAGFAFTEDRHKMQEKIKESESNHHDQSAAAMKRYKRDNPVGGWFDGLDNDIDDAEVARNRAEWERRNHARGENSWNPFRGLTDRSYDENKKSRKKELPEETS